MFYQLITKKMSNNSDMEMNGNKDELLQEDATNLQAGIEDKSDAGEMADKMAEDEAGLQKKFEDLNDAHLRLRAEFDNYRKRTLREKADLIRSGGESALTALLPVVDDLERALHNVRQADDIEAVKEGLELICTKFTTYLGQQGVKPIEATGKPFDPDTFEAIATIPAPGEELKGKVIDCVQTGYTLYDKIIRHAKVVVGE
jgi:molecular chaperone GrpE